MTKPMMIVMLVVMGWNGPSAKLAAAQDPETTFEFDDDLVVGDLLGPSDEPLSGRRLRPRDSLIRLRTHFVPEVTKSVDAL